MGRVYLKEIAPNYLAGDPHYKAYHPEQYMFNISNDKKKMFFVALG